MPVASTSPAGSAASSASVIAPGLGAGPARPARGPGRSRPCRPSSRRADQPRASAGWSSQAGTRPAQRSAAGSPRPRVERVGGQPGRVAVGRRGPVGQQPGGRGQLDDERRRGLVDVQASRGRLEVAHAEAAAAQGRRRLGAPLVQQQLHAGVRPRTPRRPPPGRPGRRRARWSPPRAGRRPRRGWCGRRAARARPRRAAPACRPPRGTSSRRASSSSAGRRGVRRRRRMPARAGGRPRRRGVDVLEHRPGGAATAHRAARRPRPASRRVIGSRAQPADPDAPSRTRRRRSADAAAGRLPGQGEVDQPVDGASTAAGSASRCPRIGSACGLTGDHEGIKDGELEAGEPVERAVQRRSRGGPRRQLARSREGGRGEIGTLTEQPRRAARRASRAAGRRGRAGASGLGLDIPSTLLASPAVSHRERVDQPEDDGASGGA